MIVLKTSRELSVMRKAGRISQKALRLAGEAVEPGVSAWEIDKLVRQYIESEGAKLLRVRRLSRQRVYFSERRGHPRHTEEERHI